MADPQKKYGAYFLTLLLKIEAKYRTYFFHVVELHKKYRTYIFQPLASSLIASETSHSDGAGWLRKFDA